MKTQTRIPVYVFDVETDGDISGMQVITSLYGSQQQLTVSPAAIGRHFRITVEALDVIKELEQ